jgi:hypothetical protein
MLLQRCCCVANAAKLSSHARSPTVEASCKLLLMLLMLLACAAAGLKRAAAVGDVGLLGEAGPSLLGLGHSCMASARARHL